VVFDHYLDQSLKNQTRKKEQANTSTEFEIHPEMKLTMSLRDQLSASRSKRTLTCMFAEGLLDQFSDDSVFKLLVARYMTRRSKVMTLKNIIHMKRLIH